MTLSDPMEQMKLQIMTLQNRFDELFSELQRQNVIDTDRLREQFYKERPYMRMTGTPRKKQTRLTTVGASKADV